MKLEENSFSPSSSARTEEFSWNTHSTYPEPVLESKEFEGSPASYFNVMSVVEAV
jgi:hypothetical protein